MKTLRITLLIPASLVIGQISAQTYYPGGLGNSKLFLWLNAKHSSSVTLNSSTSQVNTWSDLSGNGNNFTQGNSTYAPTYSATGNPDNNPGITFSGGSKQYLGITTPSFAYSYTGGISVFAQVSYSAVIGTWGWQRIFDFGNGTSSDNFMMGRYGVSSNNYYEGWSGGTGDQTYTTGSPISNGVENLYEAIQQGGTAGSLTNVAQYVAGASQAVAGAVQPGNLSQTWVPAAITRNKNYLGRSNWTSDEYFSGTMSEILLYDTALLTTRRVIIENYLAAEWGKTVSAQKYTAPGGAYGTDLVGIGYTSATDNFTSNANGFTDGLGFSSGTGTTDFLKTAGYIMAAHNGQGATVVNNPTLPGITSANTLTRWNRSWNIQQTGGNSAGAVTLTFSFSDYGGGTFNTANNFALLYNAADGTFASGTNKLISTTPSATSTSAVSFKVTASSLATGYYTILYSSSPITLPVTLSGFTATAQGNTALLQWSTSSATAFSRFSVERSADGLSFSAIGSVAAAAANGATVEDYTYTDEAPLPGMNYYRLAMIDQDGTTAWSVIHSVGFGASGSAPVVTVYPNPVVSELHVALADATGAVAMRLVNSQGQVLRTIAAVAPATVDIPVNGLAHGVYFLTIDGASGHYVHEILKD